MRPSERNSNKLTAAAKEQGNDIDNNSNNNNNHTNEECLAQWKQWVPMFDSNSRQQLHATLQLAQLCMLQKVDELLSRADIPYWICGGALMGVLRHDGNLIPHDDDIDIECYEEDLPKIAAIISSSFNATKDGNDTDASSAQLYTGFNYKSMNQWEGHSVATLQFFDGLLQVDVFPRPKPLPEGERYFPSATEVFPLTRYVLGANGNVQVWGPHRHTCGNYLDRCYGSDWRETVCVWNHDYNWYHSASFDPRKQMLPLTEYNTIVAGAGIQPPVAEPTAEATFQRILHSYNPDDPNDGLHQFRTQYNAYRFQRTVRRNRAVAEHREKQRQEETNSAS